MPENIGLICHRDVVTIRESDDLTTAAQRMREKHVGFLIVAEPDPLNQTLKPTGVLTDRDIVIAVVAKDVDAHALKAGDVMSQPPVVVTEDRQLGVALQEMRRAGVRRMPVVGEHGNLVGVISIDDVLETLAKELGDIAGSIRNEQRAESAFRA